MPVDSTGCYPVFLSDVLPLQLSFIALVCRPFNWRRWLLSSMLLTSCAAPAINSRYTGLQSLQKTAAPRRRTNPTTSRSLTAIGSSRVLVTLCMNGPWSSDPGGEVQLEVASRPAKKNIWHLVSALEAHYCLVRVVCSSVVSWFAATAGQSLL